MQTFGTAFGGLGETSLLKWHTMWHFVSLCNSLCLSVCLSVCLSHICLSAGVNTNGWCRIIKLS